MAKEDEVTGEPEAAPVAGPLATVRCITSLKPWATVHSGTSRLMRPLDDEEEVQIPAKEAAILQRRKHAVIVNRG